MCLALMLAGSACAGAPDTSLDPESRADTSAVAFDRLIDRATQARWDTLSIGERIGRFGLALEGTPYADATLEGPGEEVCRVTAAGFDCVTFMESCLALARITDRVSAAAAPPRFAQLMDSVTSTRYRDGRIDGYTSRLHYTSEWIIQNAARGVLEDITASLGGKPTAPGVGYMSAHPDRYPALSDHPGRVSEMRLIEKRINDHVLYVIPKAKIAEVDAQLMTGDLIAITTSIDGLDYSHTGMIFRDAQGEARFLHASSAQHRVVLDVPLRAYLAAGLKSQTGITVLRPLERTAR